MVLSFYAGERAAHRISFNWVTLDANSNGQDH